MELTGKISLVSGSSRGIGRAIAIMLAEAGSDIIVNYVSNESAALEVVEQVKKHRRRAIAIQGDVSDRKQVGLMVDQAQKELGPIQILVNNAGITRDRSFLKLSPEQWHEVLITHLDGAFNLTGRLLPGMIESRWGRIINITSIVGQIGNFGQSNYAVAKGGLMAFTKTLAREVAMKGVTVNAVSPGYIETDMTAVVPENVIDIVKQFTPMGRLGKPEEVAIAVRFLADPRASFITGTIINVNGGMYM
ncbi:MAG: 3-oxoacyl-ACP reductase FabG [Planctomycetes bacterium]|nr:3-oxoacyl-ACP reductase FabG [Planctomycetota bacterium]MBI3833772.1 3-oxoacyl-ACP reductase FabG [Planctomycetota bacterium]